jgi:hypothetical protein
MKLAENASSLIWSIFSDKPGASQLGHCQS